MVNHIHLLRVAHDVPVDQRNEYFTRFVDDECRAKGWTSSNVSIPRAPEISAGDGVDIWRLSFETD